MSAESTPTQAKHRSIMPELGRHSFIYTVGNLLTRSVGFVMLPLYTRFLTPQEFGVVELTELTVSVVTLLALASAPSAAR
jgi:O-antigen/teichoic acid export membrane protein